jgi:hypothetical protein
LNHTGYGESLAAAGYSQQHLVLGAILEAPYEGFYSLRLITLRAVLRLQFESHGILE